MTDFQMPSLLPSFDSISGADAAGSQFIDSPLRAYHRCLSQLLVILNNCDKRDKSFEIKMCDIPSTVDVGVVAPKRFLES